MQFIAHCHIQYSRSLLFLVFMLLVNVLPLLLLVSFVADFGRSQRPESVDYCWSFLQVFGFAGNFIGLCLKHRYSDIVVNHGEV